MFGLMGSASGGDARCGWTREVPRQEFFEAIDRMGTDAGEHIAQVGFSAKARTVSALRSVMYGNNALSLLQSSFSKCSLGTTPSRRSQILIR